MHKQLALALIVALVITNTLRAQDPPPAGADRAAPDPQFVQKSSYAIGLDLGRQMRADGMQFDIESLTAGAMAGFQETDPRWSDDELAVTMQRFQQVLFEKRMKMAAKDNLERGTAFLAENVKNEGVVQTNSGLQYKVLTNGDGASPTLKDRVRCHYRGTTIDGEEFDSSYSRGEPAEFPVAGVIAGWTEALQMMKVGDKYQLFIPSKLAYGERGAGGAIGPNETLIFEVELLGIAR